MNENNTVGTAAADDWDDIDLSDVSDTETDEPGESQPESPPAPEPGTGTASEADPAEGAAPAEPAEPEAKPTETAQADQSFTLKYMGEEKVFSRDETVALAQKGMDYDRIREKLTEQQGIAAANAEAMDFVKMLADEAKLSPDALMESIRAERLSKSEGISLEEAQGRLRLRRKEADLTAREKALEEKTAADTAEADEKKARERDFLAFFKARPDVKAADIPAEVFRRMQTEKISLLAAYSLYENARLKAELEAERQNQKNKERSVGSADTSGKRTPADEFDAAWYDGT